MRVAVPCGVNSVVRALLVRQPAGMATNPCPTDRTPYRANYHWPAITPFNPASLVRKPIRLPFRAKRCGSSPKHDRLSRPPGLKPRSVPHRRRCFTRLIRPRGHRDIQNSKAAGNLDLMRWRGAFARVFQGPSRSTRRLFRSAREKTDRKLERQRHDGRRCRDRRSTAKGPCANAWVWPCVVAYQCSGRVGLQAEGDALCSGGALVPNSSASLARF